MPIRLAYQLTATISNKPDNISKNPDAKSSFDLLFCFKGMHGKAIIPRTAGTNEIIVASTANARISCKFML